MTPEERFEALVDAFIAQPGVTPPQAGGKAFGSNALKVHNKIFAMLRGGRLVVKLPRQRVQALVAAGAGAPIEPGTGRVMKEWLALDPKSSEDWVVLADEARAFVSGR